MRKVTKKVSATAFATALLAGGGVAFAYWTNTGSGAGSATTGSNTGVTVTQTSVISGLYPGQGAVTLSGKFNNLNSGAVYVTDVTATGYTVDSASVTAGCAASGNYTLGGTAAVGASVPAGTAVGSWSGLTIAMNNTGSNQDACKDAVLTITYASS
ncbi:MAG: hypothetical protein QOF35_1486 [Actinomycetota bacterium]|jgi:hypothetical protein|nr:hypothetical protein [Actinomycetota bacterium]